ncbi:MAG: hypothetical protein L0216_12160 [Planctomycetales bacterium]|nr:hypothetical protein [Planctomycetales bacterium]
MAGGGAALAVLGAGAAGVWRAAPLASDVSATVLDERALAYREEEDGRRVAEVRATLVRRRGGAVLSLAASAVGPAIEPPPDWRWRRGGNPVTARELTELPGRGLLEIETITESGACLRGSLRPARRGRLPERRARADATLDHLAEGADEWVVELLLVTPLLPPGRHETRVRASGEVRLRVETESDDSGGRILALEQVQARHGSAARP